MAAADVPVASGPAADALIEEGDERCALWWRNAPALAGQRLGLIGAYAPRGADGARRLLDAACARLRLAGCTTAVGPMDGSTWHRYRLTTWTSGAPLFFMEADNPADWPAHFVDAGFAPLAHYYSSQCDDLAAYGSDPKLEARLRRQGWRDRAIDVSRLDAELALLWRLASDAFAENFLYTPITEAEFHRLYQPAIGMVRPELVRIAEQQGQPFGFVFGLPDMLQAAHGRVDTVIVKTLGVSCARRGRGVGSWLVERVLTQARALGFRKAIFALMHEDNASRRIGRGHMRDIRRYTLYAKPL